ELGVALVAVEEVLGVEQHLEPGAAQVLDRVGHHGDGLFERGLQRFGDVVVPALADDAHRSGARFDEVTEGVVGVDLAELAPGRPERHQPAGVEVELGCGAAEELVVLGVGARPTAFDVVHAQPVELLGDAQLVVDGERDALELAAVAQGRVEDLDGSRYVRRWSSSPRTAAKKTSWMLRVMGPGRPISWSSTERMGTTSAAVPERKASSAV